MTEFTSTKYVLHPEPQKALGGIMLKNPGIGANRFRSLDLMGQSFITNVPAYITAFKPALDLMSQTTQVTTPVDLLVPSATDRLAVGEYQAVAVGTDTGNDPNGQDRSHRVAKKIIVAYGPEGKVISHESFDRNAQWRKPAGNSVQLMGSLGYMHNQVTDRFDAMPTPDTVRRTAASQGVKVRFFDQDNYYISGKEYVASFADGEYPINRGNELAYVHDVEDDHLTAMVLGGTQLRDTLQLIAAGIMARGKRGEIDAAAEWIDRYTARLRAVIAPSGVLVGRPYGTFKGRATLNEAGMALGITSGTTDSIITAAQVRGREFNMDVQELAA